MPNFSMITVTKEKDNLVSGYWVQDCCGTTLEEALERADKTSKLNRNSNIAIVDAVSNTRPILAYFTNLKRLKNEKNDN